jgi:hypothetical protein
MKLTIEASGKLKGIACPSNHYRITILTDNHPNAASFFKPQT